MRSLATILFAMAVAGGAASGQSLKTKHVILMTSDGVRWQDVFRGADPMLMDQPGTGMKKASPLGKALWAESASERARLLMPFFWSTVAAKGVVFGDRDRGGAMAVTNRYHVSYPGYSEILTGRAQDDLVKSNDKIRNPVETVLEFIQRKKKLSADGVAVFASWDAFSFISSKRADALFVNAGYSAPSWAKQPARVSELGRMQFEARSPWDEERHDLFTFEMAFDYLKSVRPRVMYIAFDETDDWAHDRRYDRVLESLQYFDHCLERVWTWVQNSPEYRGNTTLILTTDHGRGKTLSDWHSHGEKVPDSKEIWAAVMGPDTPEGGVVRGGAEIHQRDIAPTMLKLMGIDPREYEGVEGTAIALALPAAER